MTVVTCEIYTIIMTTKIVYYMITSMLTSSLRFRLFPSQWFQYVGPL